MDVNVRKALAGADSYGNTWPEDGSVVSVPYEQAVNLLVIKDAGFTLVDEPADEPEPEAAPEPVPATDPEFSEVDPDAPEGEPDTDSEPAKPAAKKTVARKTAARKTVEE